MNRLQAELSRLEEEEEEESIVQRMARQNGGNMPRVYQYYITLWVSRTSYFKG